MVRLIAALCLSLIAVTSLAETWVRKGFPPDKETLDRYKQGGLSDQQELLAKAFLELAGRYNDDKRTREVKDAIRRALIFHPANPAALALYEAQPALPKKPKLYKNRPLGKAYLADLQKLQARLTPELLKAAEVFAKHGMPLACQYALEQARQGNEQGKKKLRQRIAAKTAELRELLAKLPLRIQCYNLLYPGGTDINDKNPEHWDWAKRRPLHDDVIRVTQPDIIGIQEISSWQPFMDQSWAEIYTMYRLTDFVGKSKPRDSDCAIYYNHFRFEVMEKGYRHLNRWNNINNRKADWGASNNRQMGWLRFRDKWTGNQFYFYNTHTAWPGESYKSDEGVSGTTDDLHAFQIAVCLEEIESRNTLLPMFFTGDFNNRGGKPWSMLCENGPFDVKKSYRDKAFGIDWILCSEQWEPVYTGTVYSKKDDVRASDHLTPFGYYKYPDPELARRAWEADPDSIEKLAAFLRVLVISKQAETIKLLKEKLKEIDKDKRDPLLWLQAEVEDGFGEPKQAIKYYKALHKAHKKGARAAEAAYYLFRVLVKNNLASNREIKAMRKFVIDDEIPAIWRDKVTRLLAQLG